MTYLKPLPNITDANKPFWDGLKNREFLVPKCKECGAWNWTPYPACRNCQGTDLEWVKVSGEGRIYTYTIVQRGSPAFMAADGTWVIAFAKLTESSGPRSILVMSNLINCKAEDVKIGMPVKIVYDDIPDEDVTLYKFAPA